MTQLTAFQFDTHEIRVLMLDNEPWFVAKELAAVLDYADSSKMLNHVDEEDKQVINPQHLDSAKLAESFGSNTFKLSIINESGLYAVILGSHKPDAKQFKRWVTSEVLPTIRKTGYYTQKEMTPGELLKLQAEAIISVEQKQKEQALLLQKQDSRLQKIEERFEKADEQLKALPATSEEVPTKSIRSSLNELLRAYAYRTGEDHRYLWSNLYKEYRYRYHVDLVARAKNQKQTVCAYAEDVGVIDKLYATAILLYGIEGL